MVLPLMFLPSGPLPPEVAGHMVCLRWIVMISMVVGTLRLLINDGFFSVGADMAGVVAAICLLKDDAMLGRLAHCILHGFGGACGEGGVACLSPVIVLNGVNSIFAFWKVLLIGVTYKAHCFDASRSHKHSSDTLAEQRFLGEALISLVQASNGVDVKDDKNSTSMPIDSSSSVIPADAGSADSSAELHRLAQEACPYFFALLLGVTFVTALLQFVSFSVGVSILKTIRASVRPGPTSTPTRQHLYRPAQTDWVAQADALRMQQAMEHSRLQAFSGQGHRIGDHREPPNMGGGAPLRLPTTEEEQVRQAILSSQTDDVALETAITASRAEDLQRRNEGNGTGRWER